MPPNPQVARQQLLEQALFRGSWLSLRNPAYVAELRAILGALYATDALPAPGAASPAGGVRETSFTGSELENRAPRDLTVSALELQARPAGAVILARQAGLAAGLEEAVYFLEEHGVRASMGSLDSAAIEPGAKLLELRGDLGVLLTLERTTLNLLQRMSGIATAAHKLQRLASASAPGVRTVATRKTVWGLLDKRAVHLGGGGTHRLGLGDAILIKNNHLALLSSNEEMATAEAIRRAWPHRQQAAFIEVEVRSASAALAAGHAFRDLQEHSANGYAYPSLILLDNMSPRDITQAVEQLKRERLYDHVLLEASGAVSEENIGEFAQSGVDAISVGALTHSARALDISMRVI